MKPKYFEVMNETSQSVDPILKSYLKGIKETAEALPKSRIGKARLRDLTIRLGYEISGGKDWREVIPVCVSYEFLNCSNYVINWIFDEKGGNRNKREVNDLIIGGFQLRELAEQVLRERGLERITNSISKINKAVYEGQNLDLNVLTLENYESFNSFEDFMITYKERCKGLCGEFLAQCLLTGSKVSGNENPILYEIGEILGSGVQASNDLGDFALPNASISVSEKPYKDQLSDLRQGKLTLPVYLLAKKLGERDENLTRKPSEEIVKLLHSTGSFQQCYNYLKKEKKRAKKKLYESFEESDLRNLLAATFVAITSNKFIRNLRNAKEQ